MRPRARPDARTEPFWHRRGEASAGVDAVRFLDPVPNALPLQARRPAPEATSPRANRCAMSRLLFDCAQVRVERDAYAARFDAVCRRSNDL